MIERSSRLGTRYRPDGPFHRDSVLAAALAVAWMAAWASGITIRSDVPDAQYTMYSADPQFESSLAISYHAISNPSNLFYCSGTLIHPEWVLTAAHCTIESTAWITTAYRGADRTNPSQTIPVDVETRNSAFDQNNPALGNDFGLLHLTTPVIDITPARMYRSTSELGVNAAVVGYGRTGTGLTGENAALPNGIRRAMDNRVDAFGGTFGWSSKLLAVDFDNPANPGDSVIGPSTPLPLEGAVALNDSGGGWFQQIGGVPYLTGVTSFRASADGSPNSDYGDLSVGGRVSQDLSWIDSHYDRTLFWNGSSGTWDQAAQWYGGIVPTAASAAIVETGTISLVTAGETADYVFLQGTGRLILSNNLQTSYLRMRSNSRLELAHPAGIAAITGDLSQEGGTLQFDLGGINPGQYDQFQVGGDATLNGVIDVQALAGYAGPATRGMIDTFDLLTAANLQVGTATVQLENIAIGTVATYVGSTNTGMDGLFARYEVTSTGLSLAVYLAIPGDANGDGTVDGSDFGIWNSNKFTSGNNWQTGDFNGDGDVDGSDFGIWNGNKFTSVAMHLVPEPGAVLWLGIVAWLLTKRGRC